MELMGEESNKSILHTDVDHVLKKRLSFSIFNLFLLLAILCITAFFAGTQTNGMFSLFSRAAMFQTGLGPGGFTVFSPSDTPPPSATPIPGEIKICHHCDPQTNNTFKCGSSITVNIDDECADGYTDNCPGGCQQAWLTPIPTIDPGGTFTCYKCNYFKTGNTISASCSNITKKVVVGKPNTCSGSYKLSTCDPESCLDSYSRPPPKSTPIPPPTLIPVPVECGGETPDANCQDITKARYYFDGVSCIYQCYNTKINKVSSTITAEGCKPEAYPVSSSLCGLQNAIPKAGTGTPGAGTTAPKAGVPTNAPNCVKWEAKPGDCARSNRCYVNEQGYDWNGCMCAFNNRSDLCDNGICPEGNCEPKNTSGGTGGGTKKENEKCGGNGECFSGFCNNKGWCEAEGGCGKEGDDLNDPQFGGLCCAGFQNVADGICRQSDKGGQGPGGSCAGSCVSSSQACRNQGGSPSGSGGCPAGNCCN